jgi:translation initiation factor 3 subunit L
MWSPTVRSYLKLYTTMDIKKLAGFLEIDADTLRGWLLVNKQRSKQVRHTEGGLLDGDVVTTNDLDYAMQGVSYEKKSRIMPNANMKFRRT